MRVKTNIPTLRNFISGVIFGLVVVVIMSFTVGCSKSSGGGSGKFGWGASYNGVPSIGQFMANSISGAQLAVQFNTSSVSLVGPVYTNGELYIAAGGITCNGGGAFGALAPGVWTIDATNQIAAEMHGDFITDVSLTAYGPVHQVARIEIDQVNLTVPGDAGYLYSTGYSCTGAGGFNEMYANHMRIYINGSSTACVDSYIDTQTSPSSAVCL
jgi:hypothetical protein